MFFIYVIGVVIGLLEYHNFLVALVYGAFLCALLYLGLAVMVFLLTSYLWAKDRLHRLVK